MENKDEKIFLAIRAALNAKDAPTQQKVAEAIGCSRSFVGEVKNGNRAPGGYTRRFCEVLGLDANTGLPLNQTSTVADNQTRSIRARVRRAAAKPTCNAT